MNSNDPIVHIPKLQLARDDDRTVYLVLEVVLESGATTQFSMTEEAAARAYLLIDRARKDLGWQLREADIAEHEIH